MSQNEAAVLRPNPPSEIAQPLLSALAHVTFSWDAASDAIAWSDNCADVFQAIPADALRSAKSFAALIEPAPAMREDALRRCSPASPAYRISYGARATTAGEPLWIDESAICTFDDDGKVTQVRGLMRIDRERRVREEELLRLSRHDPLTGELNRQHLHAALVEAINDAALSRASLAFGLIGIDHLGRINEAFGFDVADEVICEVTKRVRDRLRGGDLLGRFSGNKLGIVLKNCTADDYAIAAERFLAGIRDDVITTRLGPVAVTATIGAVTVPRYARDADEAVNRAQEALNSAKSRRPGTIAVWRPNVERDAQRRLNIRVTDEIVTALNDRLIVTAFEPVVDATSRLPVFHECLVRMRQDDGKLLLAPDVVPVAERLGLIRLVDHRMLELAVEELAANPQISLSLNISPETTRDPDWWSSIESMMRAHPGVGERLIVEITETVAIQDVDDVRGFVTRLKNFGSRIAIDDFGAGFTSFRNLRKLGVDIVKIDGAFVQNIANSADDRAFVQSLIDLSRRLGIRTVAEWVQDEASATLLRDWGCDYIQGRLIGLASAHRPWAELPVTALPAAC